ELIGSLYNELRTSDEPIVSNKDYVALLSS
nr:hypothetical protein [Tanacetum cinerariifolium]